MFSLSSLRQLGKLLLPPIVARPLALLWPKSEQAEFGYLPGDGKKLKINGNEGWNVESVVAAERARWDAFGRNLEGSGPLGFSHENPDLTITRNLYFHNLHMTYAYVLALAAGQRENVRVLDWGGGLGYYYQLGKALLPGVKLDFSCRELPLMCEYGRKVCPEVTFYSDDSCLEKEYDLVIVSGTLQYLDDWAETLTRITAAVASYLFLTRVSVVEQSPSFVLVHRTASYQYGPDMLLRVFNKHELVGVAEAAGLQVLREFVGNNSYLVKNAPEECVECGWLFKRIGPAKQ
jgi:putative methyltransferase (TIGR04325 family)